MIIVGDIGGLPVYPYYTFAQTRVAEVMEDWAIRKKNTFENIYNGKGLNVPWYMTAGNHDYLGNISAQISYTNNSHKWRFPGLYYKLSFPLAHTCVEILMIDTIMLCGNVVKVQKDHHFRQEAERQWRWIEENLKISKADYLFVAGHYPIHSMASHGPTNCLRERLDPLLKRYHVSAYFSGHDHTLQHIVYPIKEGYEMHYVVSGAGSRSDHSTKHLGTIPTQFLMFHYPIGWNPVSNWGFTYGGFLYMEITKRFAIDFVGAVKDITTDEGTAYLKIIVVGDIGGLPEFPYYTYAQSKLEKVMENWAKEKDIHCVVSVGDNIYYVGVKNEHDSRFHTTFENVYRGPGLNVSWYTIAGNHDHFGNITAQIAYTNHSQKWVFPELYYKLSFTRNNFSVDVLMIDTIVLCGNTADIKNGGFFDIFISKRFHPKGPSEVTPAEKQWRWIEENLNSSRADYLFVVGHYPVYSMGSHGPTDCLRERLNPLLRFYNVSAYLSGHEHNLQHIVYPTDRGHLLHYVVSGAGSRADHSKKHIRTIPKNFLKFHYPSSWNPVSQLGFTYGGFVFMEITKANATLEFVTGNNVEKYKATIEPRLIAV
ncbi:unnamed protein product [Cylicocyclus nassatus]|uniref:Tartrate-resistant acid phosphatase type 5 n=1 Tax=Cylicocyclus nassatus TaxID=53992 RepID=A0AA36GIB6_CYLNA|nr:unnamed protein product [Cylicocyclus nassatus]